MAAMVWYHTYFIVVTMFGTGDQWALYPRQALYPTLLYFSLLCAPVRECQEGKISSSTNDKMRSYPPRKSFQKLSGPDVIDTDKTTHNEEIRLA